MGKGLIAAALRNRQHQAHCVAKAQAGQDLEGRHAAAAHQTHHLRHRAAGLDDTLRLGDDSVDIDAAIHRQTGFKRLAQLVHDQFFLHRRRYPGPLGDQFDTPGIEDILRRRNVHDLGKIDNLVEVILVDNASTDGSVEVIKSAFLQVDMKPALEN